MQTTQYQPSDGSTRLTWGTKISIRCDHCSLYPMLSVTVWDNRCSMWDISQRWDKKACTSAFFCFFFPSLTTSASMSQCFIWSNSTITLRSGASYQINHMRKQRYPLHTLAMGGSRFTFIHKTMITHINICHWCCLVKHWSLSLPYPSPM